VAEARGGDDFALSEGRDRVAMMEDHFVAVAGGRILGGTMLLEDTARLVSSLDPAPLHAYLFRAGEQGDREESMPILYGKRVAGNGLLAALGVKATWDPGEKVLTLSRGDLSKAYAAQEGSAAASFLFRSASGAGPSRFLECVVASGYAGNALLDAENAALSGLGLSEIPGNVRLAEAYTGRVLECRRALARVEIPERGAGAIVEVICPR